MQLSCSLITHYTSLTQGYLDINESFRLKHETKSLAYYLLSVCKLFSQFQAMMTISLHLTAIPSHSPPPMVHQPHTATTSQTVQRCHRKSKPEPRRAIHKTMVVNRKYQRRIEWVKGWSGLGSSIVVWGGEVKQGIGYPLRCDFLLWSTEPASLGHYDVVRKVLSLMFWDIQKPGEKTSVRKTLGDRSLLSEHCPWKFRKF
jgi:hypothetical protein